LSFKKLGIFLICLISLTCSKDPVKPSVDYEPEINIFALLTLNNSNKRVIVEETFRSDSYLPAKRGVENAEVYIRRQQQEIHLQHIHNGRYIDTLDILEMRSGETYTLFIQLPDGREFSAQTVIPDAPKIIQPQHAANVPAYNPLEVQWNASKYAKDYIVSITNIGGDFTTSTLTDTLETTIFPFLFAPPNVYIIKVAAASPDYFTYIQTPPHKNSQGNIQGAVGVFGAIAYKYISVEAE